MHDALTTVATTAYCRIASMSLTDVRPMLELLSFGGFSAAMGVFEVIGCDQMVPSEDDQRTLLNEASRFHYEKGFGDPRYGLAVAAAGWTVDQTKAFLDACLLSGDSGAVQAAERSLQKKYSACR